MQLTTDRLFIRELTDADMPEFEPTLNEAQRTCLGSPKGFLDFLISQYAEMDITRGVLSFGVFSLESGKLLGSAGAGRHDDLGEPEIFYYLLPEYRGHGYAAEAAAAITEWALGSYNIPYLIGTVAVDNEKSQHVLERCGYSFIDERTLLVHVTGKSYKFRYYRKYRQTSSEK